MARIVLLLLTCGVASAQDRASWLNEGAIYETHPSYYDGTLKALTAAVASIAELGIKTIYIMPIWEHKKAEPAFKGIYLINDYFKIAPSYGTPDDLKEVVARAHEHGLKVLLDLVTCCAPPGSAVHENKWMFGMSLADLRERAAKLGWELEEETREGRKFIWSGREKRPESAKTLYRFCGEIVGDDVIVRHCPHADWGPAVDRRNPEVIAHFAKVAAHYVKEFDIDGWRIDAPGDNWNRDLFPGDHSSAALLKAVKEAVRRAKPEAAFLSEGGLPKGVGVEAVYVHPKGFSTLFKDGGMNTPKLVEELNRRITPVGPLPAFVPESHDSPRLAADAPALQRPFVTLMSTLPGIPFVQAGQEIGTRSAFWSRPRVDWEKGDRELREFYRKTLSLRARLPALREGKLANVWKGGDGVYAFARLHEDGPAIVVVNVSDKPVTAALDLSILKAGTVLRDEFGGAEFTVNAEPQTTVEAYGCRILLPRP